MKTLLLAVVVSLSGCLPYPVYKTLQPESKVLVTDPAGQAVKDATVELTAVASPHNRQKSKVTLLTNAEGVVMFEGKHEWRIESLSLHGADIFSWFWCVRKSGFGTFETRSGTDDDVPDILEVQLNYGESTECPQYGF